MDTLYSIHDTEVLFVYTVTHIIYSDTIVSLNLLPCIQMKYLTIFLLMTRANNNNHYRYMDVIDFKEKLLLQLKKIMILLNLLRLSILLSDIKS